LVDETTKTNSINYLDKFDKMKLNFNENHKLLFLTIFFGFLILSFLVAIEPAFWVQGQSKPLPNSKPLTNTQMKGFEVYVSEGCVACHTQQVRPLPMDEKRFGRASTPGDYAYLKPLSTWVMTPEILGTERTGPDLSNVGNRQTSAIWNYIHLYNPRAVVKESVMQAYPWLFKIVKNPSSNDIVVPIPKKYAPKEGSVVPTEKAKDLVAYILSRKQVPLKGYDNISKTNKSETKTSNSDKTKKSDNSLVKGKQIFSSNCASCHQQNGEGLPGVFPPLKGDPIVNLGDGTNQIKIVLFGLKGKEIGGVKYMAVMPSHATIMTDEQIADVINYERSSWGNHSSLVTPEQVKKVRNQHKSITK